jgi:hypothetical protein
LLLPLAASAAASRNARLQEGAAGRASKQASPYATEDREFAVTACTGILPLAYVSSLLEFFFANPISVF